MIRGIGNPTSAALVWHIELSFAWSSTSTVRAHVRQWFFFLIFRSDAVLRSSFLRSYDPTIYLHETALSIASKEAAKASLSDFFQSPDDMNWARIWTSTPRTTSVHVRGKLSFTQCAVPRSERWAANIFPTIQIPETVFRGDAVELEIRFRSRERSATDTSWWEKGSRLGSTNQAVTCGEMTGEANADLVLVVWYRHTEQKGLGRLGRAIGRVREISRPGVHLDHFYPL